LNKLGIQGREQIGEKLEAIESLKISIIN